MSRWHGKYGKGARQALRAQLRAEAEERNARTPEVRRKATRASASRATGPRREIFKAVARTRPRFVWHSHPGKGLAR